MAIKFSQFNLRTDHTSGMYLVGYDGNQNIHITVDNLFDDFINGTENTIAMFGANGTVLADSILSQDAGATILTVAGQLNVDENATFDKRITVTGRSILNGHVTLGDASTDLITQTGTLYLNGPVKDTTDTLGVVDQILVSDATGELTFQNLLDTHVESAEVVKVPAKNVQGSALVKGDPVYISGTIGASGRLEVQLADASNAAKMPAVGLLFQDLANNEEGYVVVTGKLRNITTDPIDGVTPTEGDVVYVKPSGTSGAALTTTKPVYGNFIQNMGKVGRVSNGNSGTLVVSSILRSNDVPNLTPGRLWVGSTGNTIESQTLFVDEANTRLGIGTTSPAEKLHVIGSTLIEGSSVELKVEGAGNYDTANITMGNAAKADTFEILLRQDPGGNHATLDYDGYSPTGTSHVRLGANYLDFDTAGSSRMRINSSGNVGIGTASPGAKLEVQGNGSNTEPAFKVTESGDRLFEVGPDNATTFLLGDLDALGDETYIKGDYSNIEIYSNGTLTAKFDSTNKVGIGPTIPRSKLHVDGAVQVADDTDVASANKVGALRYRTSGNNSYVDMCMQTGPTTYA